MCIWKEMSYNKLHYKTLRERILNEEWDNNKDSELTHYIKDMNGEIVLRDYIILDDEKVQEWFEDK